MLTEHIGLLFVKKHHINLYKTKKLHIFAARNRKTIRYAPSVTSVSDYKRVARGYAKLGM